MAELTPAHVCIALGLVVTLALAFIAWRGEVRALAEYRLRVWTEARALAEYRFRVAAEARLAVANSLVATQATELKNLSHRNRLLAHEVRSDDRYETRVWNQAKPTPVQWRPGQEITEYVAS